MMISQALLYKTKKLSSGFSRTQIPKIFKNSVFARKLSSRTGNLEKIHPKMVKKDNFRIFGLKTFKFSENSVPKR